MSSDNPYEVSSDAYRDGIDGDYDSSGIEVSRRCIDMLQQTRPWVSLIGILLWIGTIFGGIAVIIMVVGALMSGEMMLIAMAAVYVIGIIIYGVMANSLTTYGKKINSLVATERVVDLEEALAAQKTFWKIVGIFTALYLIVVVLVVVGMAATGALMR